MTFLLDVNVLIALIDPTIKRNGSERRVQRAALGGCRLSAAKQKEGDGEAEKSIHEDWTLVHWITVSLTWPSQPVRE